MKSVAGWIIAAVMATMVAAGQTPPQGNAAQGNAVPAANATCPCGRSECKCQCRGGRMGAGQAQFQGGGQGRMPMRPGRMGAGMGMCMRVRVQNTPPQTDAQPKAEKN